MDDKWEKLLLSELLEGLRNRASTPKIKEEVEYEGNKRAADEARELKKALGKIYGSTKSAADGFLKEATAKIGAFIAGKALIGSDGKALVASGAKAFLDSSGRVDNALIACEGQLRLLLPDTASADERRWPGPISYRSALNHFVAVCIRVHSIAPAADFEEVVFNVTKRVLIPAAAHNLKFFSKEYPAVYRAFVHDDQIAYRIGTKLSNSDKAPDGMPGPEQFFYRKWARLFNVMFDSAPFMSPERKGELFRFIQTLLRDYEAEPRTSQLWEDLSIIASGDMAVDEIVVARVLDDIGEGNKALASSPLISCARARFGLLRYAYDMRHDADEFHARFSHGETEVAALLRMMKAPKGGLTKEDVKKIFGWAYILSRFLLLGRQSIDASSKPDSDRQQDAAKMLCNLLDGVMRPESGADRPVRLLALRYMIGFLTNPRFEKWHEKISDKNRPGEYSSAAVDDYIRIAEKAESEGMPKSIVNMARARLTLHHAAARKSDIRGRSRELQSALDHYARILEVLASPSDAGVMDGEVIAWVLPEIYYAIGELSRCNPGDEAYWKSVQKALLVIGEVQYGIYYNPNEEMKRIEKGIQIALGRRAER
jgi:hypothetical protein